MAFPETDPTRSQSSDPKSSESNSANPPVRPSWETARPAAPPRRPAPARTTAPAEPAPYYRSAEPPVPVAPAAPAYAPSPVYQPAPVQMNVQYDLAGNPIASSAPSPAASYAPPAPFGYSAGNAAGSWPPPVGGGHAPGAQAYRNTSGEQSHLPPEIERLRWHWGAFFFPTWWSRRHGMRELAFAVVIAFVLLRVLRSAFPSASPLVVISVGLFCIAAHLAIQVYFGLNGHRIGWRNRHFPGGVEQYFKVQTAWMWWGFGLNVLLGPAILLIAFAIGVTAGLTGSHAHTPHHYSRYSGGSYSQPAGGSGYSGSNGDGSTPAPTN